MDVAKEFSRRLREAMARRGMTQTELARRLDVRDATVSDWFNRGTMPSGSVMVRLPHVLDMDGHWLLTGERPADGGGARRPLGEAERERLTALLEEALRLLRGDPPRGDGDGGGPYLRLREADAGERAALGVLRTHPAEELPRALRRAPG